MKPAAFRIGMRDEQGEKEATMSGTGPSVWKVFLPVCVLALLGCNRPPGIPGHVKDEARLASRTAASLPAADEDYFHDMDGGVKLSPEEVKGRNTWIVWTGGNDRFWDGITASSAGALDFLKTVS